MTRAGIPNSTPPAWAQALADRPPACFTPDGWRTWLAGLVRQVVARKTARKALERGGVPHYCADCLPEHRAAMQAAGRCHPPVKVIHIKDESDAAA
jgi:hypothetical protein